MLGLRGGFARDIGKIGSKSASIGVFLASIAAILVGWKRGDQANFEIWAKNRVIEPGHLPRHSRGAKKGPFERITSASKRIRLPQSVLKRDGGSVVQNDRIDVSRIRRQILRRDVKNPLLVRRIKAKRSVRIIRIYDVLHGGRHRSGGDLRQLKARDYSR